MSGTDGLSNHIRKYLLDKTNYTCEIPGCGCNFINPYTGLSILQIHHIDGDATVVTIIWLELIIFQELKNMVTLKKLKELKQIKRDNKVIYNLLNTIIGECEQISKDPSCSQVMDVIQKMYKDNKQTISECSVDRVDQLNTLNEENAFLESYLPQPLTKEELTALIGSQLTAGNNMSKIMKYLSEEYKGRYDGKVAVEIIKSLQ